MARDPEPPDTPGWYPDPDGVYEHEAYWDGEHWTGATRRPILPEARRATRRTVAIVVLLAIGGLFAIGGLLATAGCITDFYCTYDFTYLPALKSDPMANLDLPGTHLTHAYNDGEGRVLGKPTHARVMRVYAVDPATNSDALLHDAMAYAESSGWSMEEDPGIGGGYSGTKTLKTGRASIHIGVGDELVVIIRNLEYQLP